MTCLLVVGATIMSVTYRVENYVVYCPLNDADTGCIATDPAPSARRRFRSKTGIENLPANEHAQETPHTPSPTRTTRRIQSGCAGSRPRLRDGMPGSPSQHIDITRAKWIPYFKEIVEGRSLQVHERVDTFVALHAADNQNMLLNGTVEADTGIPRDKSINFLPYPGSSICPYRATEPWSLFVMLLLHYMIQVPTEPVKMLLYSGNDPY